MRQIALLALAFLLSGCGKFLDKFSREDGGHTEVRIAQDRGLAATMNGGLMIYFGREGDNLGGFARGFTSSELAQGKSILLPNGLYKVWAFGSEDGTNKLLEGSAKCGIGNGGALLSLTGGSKIVDIQISAANCAFGTNSPFGDINTANSSTSNFDQMKFQACVGAAYSSCTPNTGASFRVRMKLLAGEKPPGSLPFLINEGESLTSACSPAASSGLVTSNFLAFSGGEELSPPMDILLYADGTCSGPVVAQFRLEDGMRHFRASNITNGSLLYMDQPAASSYTTFNFKYP